jgi:hypothetical protein
MAKERCRETERGEQIGFPTNLQRKPKGQRQLKAEV